MTQNSEEHLKILIIEDDLVDKKLLERLLSRSSLSGIDVSSVGYLKEALEKVTSEDFDIILSDLGLPDSQGTQAINQLHKTAGHIPVIVLSGMDDESTAINAVQQGAQDYLIKGQVDSQVLIRSIRYAIERKKAEQNLKAAEQRYRVIFDNSAVAIMMADEQERLISWNKFTENLLGMTHEDLHFKPIRTFYPDEEWERIRDLHIRQKNVQQQLETKMFHKQGHVIDVEVSLSVLKNEDECVVGSIGVIQDITERREAAEKLDRSYVLLNATLESTADGLLAVDHYGNITSFNQKFVEMWRLSPETLKNVKSIDVFESLLDQMVNGEAFLDDVRFLSSQPILERSGMLEFKDGRVFEHYSQPQHLANQVTGRVWSFRDITEHKQAEAALLKSEERFRQVVENAEEWIWEVDANGNYTYVSPVVERILGFKPEEILGCRHFYDLFDPEEREGLKQQAFDVFQRRDTFREFETKNRDKHGNVVWLAKSGVPLLDDNGDLLGYRGVDMDITERKRVHEILHRKQRNLEAIFDAAPIGMLLVDDQMRVRRANDAIRTMAGKDYDQIINRSPGQVLGCSGCSGESVNAERTSREDKPCGCMDACRDCPLFMTIKNSFTTGKAVHGCELHPTLRIRGETVEPAFSVSTELLNMDGSPHLVVAINDITDRVRAERELRETMELKSQFISTVSHELRTPMASMKEAVLIVLDGVAGPINEDQQHFLGMAKRNLERLSRLINDVLDFQKLGTGKMKFNMQENDLTQTLEDAYNTMIYFAQKSKVNLSLEVQPNMPKGIYDSDRLIQVLTNLISNAIKFTPDDGRVTVSLTAEEGQFFIKVTDTGMGIPKEALTKIFDKFYRVNRPGKEIKGTGLGLPIVKAIINAHGGRIDVESELGQGTTFTMVLPMKQQEGAQELCEIADQNLENVVNTS